MTETQPVLMRQKLGLQLWSSKLIYALVACIAAIVGIIYKMGWLSKIPSGETVNASVSTVATLANNIPILRGKVPDVFDGQVPPYSSNPTTEPKLSNQSETPKSPVVKPDELITESPVPSEPITSIKLDTSPSITLNTSEEEISDDKLPNISINI